GNPGARPGRARRAEPARTRRVHAPPSRRPIDRRDQPDARPRHQRGEAQRVSRGEETAGGARAAQESRIVSSHYSDDDLTLYYYGEAKRPAAVERHLQDCAPCAALYREIAGTLAIVTPPDAPERGEQYGLEVWQRIRHQLPEREAHGLWSVFSWR